MRNGDMGKTSNTAGLTLDQALRIEEQRKYWRESQAKRRAKLRRLVDELFSPEFCQRCKRFGLELQFAHTKPTGLRGRSRGYTEMLKDVLKNSASYVRLCIDCHRGFDRGEFGLEMEEAPF